jgi:hypothetical protein
MTTRVVVVGLYRSGSSAAAGVLHHLGVEMGAPYFQDHYESAQLAKRLRRWWHEPDLKEQFPSGERVRKLRDWIYFLEGRGATHVGAKHPLLSLCGNDVLDAWGPAVRFIWTWRPLDESIASIRRAGWWIEPYGEQLQRRLWAELNGFFAARDHLRVDFSDMLADPAREIARIADYVNLPRNGDRFAAALASIRTEPALAAVAPRTAEAS